MSGRLEVQSEIFNEKNQNAVVSSNTFVTTSFSFKDPTDSRPRSTSKERVKVDDDGDLIVDRRRATESVIKIEHSISTPIATVGLQVWRGALCLADFVLANGQEVFLNQNVLEVGAGMGLTSIVASMFAKQVTATDVDLGGILQLLRNNFDANKSMIKCPVEVLPLNFYERDWEPVLRKRIEESSIVLAADVIYDNDVTEEFVKTIEKILSTSKTFYICLEKRYVFTLDDLDTVAPCYDHFLKCLDQAQSKASNTAWSIQQLPLDFPQYFQYERTKHLVLWRISSP